MDPWGLCGGKQENRWEFAGWLEYGQEWNLRKWLFFGERVHNQWSWRNLEARYRNIGTGEYRRIFITTQTFLVYNHPFPESFPVVTKLKGKYGEAAEAILELLSAAEKASLYGTRDPMEVLREKIKPELLKPLLPEAGASGRIPTIPHRFGRGVGYLNEY